MFRKRHEDELWNLQQELLAAEEEEYEEEPDEYTDDEYDDEGDIEDCFDSNYEEEYEQEQYQPNHVNRYRRGSQKYFDDSDLFDDDSFEDEDVLYRKDYRKAKRKQRRKKLWLLILAMLEIGALIWLILWWKSWTM